MNFTSKFSLKKAQKNLIDFFQILLFTYIFMWFFGTENVLPIVALSVAMIMLPTADFNISLVSMWLINLFLFPLGALIGQFSHTYLLPLGLTYFTFTLILLLLTVEPVSYQYSIAYLINFVFCQATPVASNLVYKRILCSIIGAFFVSLITSYYWHKKQYGKNGRTLTQQIHLGAKHKSYLLKMGLALSISMLIGIKLNVVKPLWISIVAMSLTEFSFAATRLKIIQRFIGTLIGSLLFFLFFIILIPKQYSSIFILLLGYIGFFFPEYKYKSIINAINALNTSLLLFGTIDAISLRLFSLVLGIGLVVLVYLFVASTKQIYLHFITVKN